MTFINSTSASRSATIRQCLWRYNLRYNLKIQGYETGNEPALRFGSFIHRIFELGYKEKNLQTLLEIAEKEKPNYNIPESENVRLKKCISNFIRWNHSLGETIFTEGDVDPYLDKDADIKFIGVIDRIVKGSKGGYLVIDYKTSKREKKKKDLLDDDQMKGYAFAVHSKWGVPYNQIFCAHYYPLTDNYVVVQFSEFQIKSWMKKEIDLVWRIRKKTKGEFPPQRNMYCGNCEYKVLCSHFNKDSKDIQCRLDEQIEKARLLKEAKDHGSKEDNKAE